MHLKETKQEEVERIRLAITRTGGEPLPNLGFLHKVGNYLYSSATTGSSKRHSPHLRYCHYHYCQCCLSTALSAHNRHTCLVTANFLLNVL